MALMDTYSSFNIDNINLNWYFQNFHEFGFYDNVDYVNPSGSYEDLYQMTGISMAAAMVLSFAGSSMIVDEMGNVIFGTTNYIGEAYESGSQLWEAWGFEIGFPSFYNAVITQTNTDDIALISLALAGNDTISLSGEADKMSGYDGNDIVNGRGGNDILMGANGSDRLNGGTGRDTITGGADKDILVGSSGKDVFAFVLVNDSAVGKQRDIIIDFARTDVIDLSLVDADLSKDGDQSFQFIGGRDFSGEAAEVRFKNGVVSADIDGDRFADFQIALKDVSHIAESDFLL